MRHISMRVVPRIESFIRPGIQIVFRDFLYAQKVQVSESSKKETKTMKNCYRDITVKEIGEQHIGQTLRVAGWVENIRDHGGVSFID